MNPCAPLPSPDQLSARLLKKVEIGNPPVNLKKILAIWKNVNVVEEDLDGSGYLLPLGRLGAEIVINQNDPEERRRFTIAHELGHWVLGLICEKKYGEFQQPPGVGKTTLEKWCDAFATRLLMPAPLVVSWLPPRDQPVLIDAILRASTTFGVSEEAFFIRVWELERIQVATFTHEPGQSKRSIVIERQYGDDKAKKALSELVSNPLVEQQLEIGGSMVCFTLRHSKGVVCVSGRKSAKGRGVLAVAWPQAATS